MCIRDRLCPVDQGGAEPPPLDPADVQVEGAVGARGVADGVGAPGRRDPLAADARVLAGDIGEGDVRTQGQDADVRSVLEVAYDLRVPPRRVLARLGAGRHRVGDHLVGLRPGLLHPRGPGLAGGLGERGEQAGAHGGVVLGADQELAVVAPQVAQIGTGGPVVQVGDHVGERGEEPVPLALHVLVGGREEVTDSGVVPEEVGVEELDRVLGPSLHHRETASQDPHIHKTESRNVGEGEVKGWPICGQPRRNSHMG